MFYRYVSVNANLDIVAIETPYSDTFGLFSTALMDEQIVVLMEDT